MNIKKRCLQITGFIFLVCASNAIIARPALLVNNSVFTIAFRVASAGATGQIPEYQLQPGQTAEIDTTGTYSIRRAGMGAEYTASYYNVPVKTMMQESVTNDPAHGKHVQMGDIPVVSVSSGIPYGWSFKLQWKPVKSHIY